MLKVIYLYRKTQCIEYFDSILSITENRITFMAGKRKVTIRKNDILSIESE